MTVALGETVFAIGVLHRTPFLANTGAAARFCACGRRSPQADDPSTTGLTASDQAQRSSGLIAAEIPLAVCAVTAVQSPASSHSPRAMSSSASLGLVET